MTDWSQLVSDSELEAAAKERKSTVIRKNKILPLDIKSYENQGWRLVKTDANGKATMEKDKPFFDVFENEVWMIFYKMGFKIMNSTNDFRVDFDGNTKQIDVVAIDDETCICVECKATETFERKPNFKQELESIHGYHDDLMKAIRNKYGKKLKFKFIFATKNYLITDDSADMQRINSFKLTYFDYDTVQYYDALVNHLGSAARYQLLGNLFQNQEISEIENRVVAIEGKMGNLTYYSFLIEPERMLKLSYVLHRNKANHLMMPTYQRLIKKDRLKAIRNFVNNGGYFPNSLIVSIDSKGKNIRFDQSSISFDSSTKAGTLYLPKNYHSIYVIDGQHRLYGYSESAYASNNVIPVVAFVDLDPSRQVEMFMEINENQKKVSKSLRNTLNVDLLWKSNKPKERQEALMLRVAEEMGEVPASPYYGRIVTGEDSITQMRCITTEYIKDAIKHSRFLNEYAGDTLRKNGTIDKNDNDKTDPALFNLLTKFLNEVKEFNHDEWESGSKGFLTINNTTYALIRVIDDIVNIELEKEGKSIIGDIDELFNNCNPMLMDLCEAIENLDVETQTKIKKAKGGGAKKEAWRALQVALNRKNPNFINEDLKNYIEDYCTDNNPESNGYIEEIEKYLKDKFKEALKDEDNWLATKVPDSLGNELAGKVASENLRRNRSGLAPIDEWDLISFEELGKIATYSNNWTTFAQGILTRPSLRNSQLVTLTWLKDLSSFKKKLKGDNSLSRPEFSELKEIYKDFCGGTDGIDN